MSNAIIIGITDELKRNINDKYEAYLDYYGKPYPSDDPADYYEISLKGAIIA